MNNIGAHMEFTSAPILGDILEAITDWAAQKSAEQHRKEFKNIVKTQFKDTLGADFGDVPLTMAETAFNELCFILAHAPPTTNPTSAINFETICTQLVNTIGFGAKRASKADVVAAMNALELMRLKEGM
ncbi:hypothetical protein CAQ69_20010 [Stutzerimonas stutzeri]|nr:hypothetical protein CAQ69_20010 [Stutzerimonas stutzeri]